MVVWWWGLGLSQNQWDASGPGALTKMQQEGLRGEPGRRPAALRVAEDDDGRLVVDDGRSAALDEFDAGARRGDDAGARRGEGREGGAREEELYSSSRGGRLERLREELRLSLAREDRLEHKTDRLEARPAPPPPRPNEGSEVGRRSL